MSPHLDALKLVGREGGLLLDGGATRGLLKDSLIRKCVLSVVKGIASFGARYPQPTGAPVAFEDKEFLEARAPFLSMVEKFSSRVLRERRQ